MCSEVLLHNAVLARGGPELSVWAATGHLDHVLEVPRALDVAAVVPTEVLALSALDHVGHGIDPLRMFERCEPVLLRALHIAEHVAAFERVTAGAHRTFDLDE